MARKTSEKYREAYRPPSRRFGRDPPLAPWPLPRHDARELGRRADDPFRHVIGTIPSARRRDEVTDVVSRKLFDAYPTPEKLAAAPPADVQRLIHSIGFYRMKAKYVIETSRRIVEDHGGTVPDTFEELTAFPGVGRKVANCVLVYAFGKPAIAVDTHVHRVSNRLGWVKTKTPDQTERALEKFLPRRHWLELNELLVAHGKATCRPLRPLCNQCSANRPVPAQAWRLGRWVWIQK